MESKKEYRSATRSKLMIRQAFLSLLEEKAFEKITATDIIKRADINRSTFYAHYPDARGLMEEILGDVSVVFQNLLMSMDFSAFFDDPMPILRVIVSFLEENQKLYRLIGKSRMASVMLDKFKQALIKQVLACPNLPVANPNSPATEIRVRILLSGVIDAYRQWLDGEFSCSLEEATQEVAKIIQLWAENFEERIR